MTTLVRDKDLAEYRRFSLHQIRNIARALPPEIWHYTDADGLIGILKTGTLLATQVTCLNDSLEQRYFGDLILEETLRRLKTETDPDVLILLRVAAEALRNRDFSSAGHFVTCFSEIEDDLGQWRGYGGGECGYSIGFRATDLLEAVKPRPGLLVPMTYDATKQNFIVSEVMSWAEKYFRAGLTRGITDKEQWAKEFLVAFATELDVLASALKHPKFASESERRIVTLLQTGEHMKLQFRQKRTLLGSRLIKSTIR